MASRDTQARRIGHLAGHFLAQHEVACASQDQHPLFQCQNVLKTLRKLYMQSIIKLCVYRVLQPTGRIIIGGKIYRAKTYTYTN